MEPTAWKMAPPNNGAMAFAPLRKAAEMPSIPPISPGSMRLVIRLLMPGCKTPPPMETGIIAARIQARPSQPLFVSGGSSTARLRVVGFSWVRKSPLALSSASRAARE